MKITILGGGPAGLYFGLLMKKQDPAHEVTVLERNAAGVTFGWGVVFSDETLGNLEESDAESYAEITRTFARWKSIDVHYRGELIRSGGHGFAGIARRKLLDILQRRCLELGVKLQFDTEVSDADIARLAASSDLFVGADGVRSRVRALYEKDFAPSLDERSARYIWLGTPHLFEAFTFLFEENQHGMFQVHAYRFDQDTSTFIAECDEASWRAAGLDRASTEESIAYLSKLFGKYIGNAPLLANRSLWINFATVRNEHWSRGNVVLLGDAAHTAHFSIGSGTKLAMEDSISLAAAFAKHASVPEALAVYEADRRPIVERTQKAAQDSLQWFESVKRYRGFTPKQFAFSLMSRSKKLGFDNLRLRDRAFVDGVAEEFDSRAFSAAGVRPARAHDGGPVPPMFTPFKLRGLLLENRVAVSPMCMYSATDGLVNDIHLVHIGARAQGGAGLVMTEMTDVSPEGRITPGCAGIYSPEHARAWKRIVDFVHGHTRAKIGMQLGHAGRKASTKLMWEGIDQPLDAGNWEIVAPSPLPYYPHSQVPREMTRADMDKVRDDFVRATGYALEAGFDLLEVHMAHGYLLSSFISPLTNARTDAYGGALENRMRFPLEVFGAVRAAWPAEKPMSVRISATDWAPGGLEGDDAVRIAKMLEAHGCDVVDVSTGQTTPRARPVYGRMFQTPFSDQVRNEAGIATIAVGNITSADQVNSIVLAGRADLCMLARPHLRDPYWTLHAAEEQGYFAQPWPVQYGPAQPRAK